MKSDRGLRVAGGVCLAFGLALATSTAAQSSPALQLLTRTSDGRLYQVETFHFATVTTHGTEAVISLSRVLGNCPDVLSPESCTATPDCSEGVCMNNVCKVPVDVDIAYVAVIKEARYCSIQRCAPVTPHPECPSGSCDGSGTCSDPGSNAEDLCLCSSCNDVDPDIPATDLVFEESFDGTAGIWALRQAELSTVPSETFLHLRSEACPTCTGTSLGQIRFPVEDNELYFLVLKWTVRPDDGAHNCSPFANLSVSYEPGPVWCAP